MHDFKLWEGIIHSSPVECLLQILAGEKMIDFHGCTCLRPLMMQMIYIDDILTSPLPLSRDAVSSGRSCPPAVCKKTSSLLSYPSSSWKHQRCKHPVLHVKQPVFFVIAHAHTENTGWFRRLMDNVQREEKPPLFWRAFSWLAGSQYIKQRAESLLACRAPLSTVTYSPIL